MPTITINEIDNTIYGRREATNDNVVLIPGTAITGPSDPVLVAAQQDFRDIFGSESPNPNSDIATAWDYANNLLKLGMPVLFKRITGTSDSPESFVTKAQADIYGSLENSLITTTGFNVQLTEVETPTLVISYTLQEAITKISIGISNSSSVKILEYASTAGDTAGSKTLSVPILAEAPAGDTPWIDSAAFIDGTYSMYIIAEDANSSNELTAAFTRATVETVASVTVDSFELESPVVATIKARYGGTYGNTFSYDITTSSSAYYLKIKSSGSIIESKRIAVIPSDASQDEANRILYRGIKSISLNNADIIMATGVTEDNFTLAITNNVRFAGGTNADEAQIPAQIPGIYKEFEDKLIYDIKFITSGGYTDSSTSSTPIAEAMVALAEARGDCLAILDVNYGLPEEDVTSFFSGDGTNSSYGVAYAPWCNVRLYDKSEKWVAPSYMFLNALSKSINSGNPIYYAPAGVKRAQLTNVLGTEYDIGTSILNEWQSNNPSSINPIMSIYGYGYVIYGQKTLYSAVDDSTGENVKSSALQELSVRIAANEIKKLIYRTALYLTFDQNNLYTWNEFKALVSPMLESMKSNGGINDYMIVMNESTMTDDDVNSGTIRGSVLVSVTRTAENFVIDFTLEPSSVTFQADETGIIAEE